MVDLTFSGDPSRARRPHLKPCAEVARVSTWNCGFHPAHPWRCGAWAAAIPDVLPPCPNAYICARRAERKRARHARRQAPEPFARKKSASHEALRVEFEGSLRGPASALPAPFVVCRACATAWGAKALPGSGVLRASETQGRRPGTKQARSTARLPPGLHRPQFAAATARRSRRANRPFSRLRGVGGQPGMLRSTGMTAATGPTQA